MSTKESSVKEVVTLEDQFASEIEQGQKIPVWVLDELNKLLKKQLYAVLDAKGRERLESIILLQQAMSEKYSTGEYTGTTALCLYQDLIDLFEQSEPALLNETLCVSNGRMA